MKPQISKTLVAVAAIGVALVAGGSVQAANLALRERVVPKGSVVRLGDVAEITSADRQESRQLAAVPLMPAPAPDTQRFLRQREITDMLAANGIETSGLRFDGAERVEILPAIAAQPAAAAGEGSGGETFDNRHAAVLAGRPVVTKKTELDPLRVNGLQQDIVRIVSEYVQLKTGQPKIGKVDCDVMDRQLRELAGATSAVVCSGGNEPWTGRQRFLLSFTTPTGNGCVPVNATVAEPEIPVVVATRAVARGNVVTAADLEVQMMEPGAKTKGQRQVVDVVDDLIGKEARQAIRPGDIVYTDSVQSPVLIKRGELITVIAQSGGIRVQTSARSMQDGAHGDLVQVESLQGKQRFEARVVGQRQAAVLATPKFSDDEPNKHARTAHRPPAK